MAETWAEDAGFSLLGSLPDDMLCQVITRLPSADRVRMSQVCKRLCGLARDFASGPFHLHLKSHKRRKFGVEAAKAWGPITGSVTLDDYKQGWAESYAGTKELERLLSLFREHFPRVQTTHTLTWFESDPHRMTSSADIHINMRSVKHFKQTLIVHPRQLLDPPTYTNLCPHTYLPHSFEFRVESGYNGRWDREMLEFKHEFPELMCGELERVVLHPHVADRAVARTALDGGDMRAAYYLDFLEKAANLWYLKAGIATIGRYWTPMRNLKNLRHLDLTVVQPWELYLEPGEEEFVTDLSFLSQNANLEYFKLSFEGSNQWGIGNKEFILPIWPKLSFLSVNTYVGNFAAVYAAATNITELHAIVKRYEEVRVVASNPNLKKLSITIGDQAVKPFPDLEPLSQCTSLTSLEVIIDTWIGANFSLGASGSLCHIRKLRVTGGNNTVHDMSATQGSESRVLELTLKECGVEGIRLCDWPRLRKATLYDFDERKVEAVTMDGVGPDFMQLHLLDSKLETLEVEGGLPGIRHLLVEKFSDPPLELTGVERLTSLVSLTVTEKLGVYDLEGIEGATGLTSLVIEEARNLDDLSALSNLKKLKRLNLHGLPPTADLTPLDSCRELVSRNFKRLERPRIVLTKIGVRREGSWNSLSDYNEYFDEEDYLDMMEDDDFFEEDGFEDEDGDGMWEDMDEDDIM